MIAYVRTVDGTFAIDLAEELVLGAAEDLAPVSYTHLTLPTIYSV